MTPDEASWSTAAAHVIGSRGWLTRSTCSSLSPTSQTPAAAPAPDARAPAAPSPPSRSSAARTTVDIAEQIGEHLIGEQAVALADNQRSIMHIRLSSPLGVRTAATDREAAAIRRLLHSAERFVSCPRSVRAHSAGRPWPPGDDLAQAPPLRHKHRESATHCVWHGISCSVVRRASQASCSGRTSAALEDHPITPAAGNPPGAGTVTFFLVLEASGDPHQVSGAVEAHPRSWAARKLDREGRPRVPEHGAP